MTKTKYGTLYGSGFVLFQIRNTTAMLQIPNTKPMKRMFVGKNEGFPHVPHVKSGSPGTTEGMHRHQAFWSAALQWGQASGLSNWKSDVQI